jgi:hypothetical protein
MSETPPETEQDQAEERLHPILRGTLERLEEEGVLESGEELVERELAGMKRTAGVLLVTDRRVLFYSASAMSDKTSLESLPLEEITSVDASERRSPIRKRGVLRLGSAGEENVLEHIPGGQARADQIAEVITRQRDALQHGPDSAAD